MAGTKPSDNFQAIIPAEIRKILGLQKGDVVLFSLSKQKNIEVSKASKADVGYLKLFEKTLSPEWESEEEEAFKDL